MVPSLVCYGDTMKCNVLLGDYLSFVLGEFFTTIVYIFILFYNKLHNKLYWSLCFSWSNVVMAKQYDASEKTLNEILSAYPCIFVPPFQRPYKWTEEQVGEFFEDVFKPIDWSRGIRSISEDKDSHYMGALVLCKDNDEKMILDGQQRLTTVTMILAYLKAYMMRCTDGQTALIRKALNYDSRLSRQSAGLGLTTPILRPQEEDNNVYQEIIAAEDLSIRLEKEGEGLSAAQKKKNKILRKRPIFKAYKAIRKFVVDYIIKPAGLESIDEFNALDIAASRVLSNLSFVVIEAHDESAAFRLFETLNDRGLDLSAADLIKNKLFAIATNSQQRKLVREKWENVSDNIGSDLVSFMRTFWLMEHDFVRKDGLFDAYKEELGKHKTDDNFLDKFLDSLNRASEHYVEISQPQPNSEVAEDIKVLNDLGAKTCRPLLLILKINRPQLFKPVVKIIEALTVRWMVSGKVFNVLETTYARVAVRVSELVSENKSDQDILLLIKSELKKLDVPDDALFKVAFEKYDVERTSKSLRYILCKINDAVSKTSEHVADSSNVHIEHIFPQDPSNEALEYSGISPEEADECAKRIGNVTLLDAKINMGLKNRSFIEKLKAERGYLQSRLAINDNLKTKTAWKKEDIEQRTTWYAELAVKIWSW